MLGLVRVCLMCALSCAAEWGSRRFTDNFHPVLQLTAAVGCVSRGVSLYDRKQVISLSCVHAIKLLLFGCNDYYWFI